MRGFIRILISGALCLIGTSCSEPQDESPVLSTTANNEAPAAPGDLQNLAAAAQATAPQGQLEEFPFGTVLRGSIWPGARNVEKSIKVCWENAGQATAHDLAVVQDAVQDTWQSTALLRFVGWQTCRPQAEQIRIRVADEGPHVKALGRYIANRPDGMVLNFQFQKWSQNCQRDQTTRDFCSRVVAVHEFGHALGFAHEQNRSDAPFECQAERQGTDGDWNITSYDPNSVMNYCNVRWNNAGELSARDVQAVQTLYGVRS